MNECRLDDDGSPSDQIIAVEAGNDPQALWMRVGPVWDGDEVRDEPGVWIEWQDRYMASSLAGPILLTPAVWRELVQAVEWRLARRDDAFYEEVERAVGKSARSVLSGMSTRSLRRSLARLRKSREGQKT